jgi:hypothetical protein
MFCVQETRPPSLPHHPCELVLLAYFNYEDHELSLSRTETVQMLELTNAFRVSCKLAGIA